MKRNTLLTALVLGVLACTGAAYAQSFAIDWSTLGSGGDMSTGGVYSVSGLIGQPDASAAMTGGGYSLTGGFWSMLAVQTPGAPLLTIARTTTNTIAVSWPSPSLGFDLQVNTNGFGTLNWSNAPGIIQEDSTRKTLIASPPTGNRFYRLFKP